MNNAQEKMVGQIVIEHKADKDSCMLGEEKGSSTASTSIKSSVVGIKQEETKGGNVLPFFRVPLLPSTPLLLMTKMSCNRG